jgi:uncharacterized protein (TIGR02001 family)
MKQLKVLSAVGLFALAGVAHADVSSTVTLTNDYDYRGFTQTSEKPAVQLSIDYSHGSGWYAGIWGSNVSFENEAFSDGGINSASTEVDVYTGFKAAFGDFGVDAGLVYYTYSGASDLNFAELYGKFSFKIVSAGVYLSNDFGGKYTGDSSDTAAYVYGDLNLPAGPVTIGLHAGLSTGDGIERAYFGGTTTDPGIEDSYMDYALGVSYAGSNFTTGIKWVTIDAGDAGSDDRIILTVSTTLPWAE